MTDLKKAAQQALEALKDCVKALDALHAPGDSIYTRASDLADRAEIALRAALAQEEPNLRNANPIGLTPPQKALQQAQFRADALEQPEQPARAQQMRDAGYTRRPTLREMAQEEQEQEQAMRDLLTTGTGVLLGGERIDPASMYMRQEQGPIAWGLQNEGGEILDCISPKSHSELSEYNVPLFTAPPRREWQSLSEDDYPPTRDGDHAFRSGAQWAEAKLKERNNGQV